MKPFLPPDSARLAPALARRNAARAARLIEVFARHAGEEARESLRALSATLGSLRDRSRRAFLLAPGFRAWLAAAEEAAVMIEPPGSDLALFNRVSGGAHLAELLPAGRMDGRFRKRAARLGASLMKKCLGELPIHLAFFTPPGETFGPFRPDLGERGECARAAGEIHFGYPAPWTLSLPPRARLTLAVPQRGKVGAGGRCDPRGSAPAGLLVHPGGTRSEWRARATIPGSSIALGRRARSVGDRLVSGPHVRGLAGKLGAALALVEEVWPWAHAEVLGRTSEVIPLVERGVVSYSMPSRPGVSYINVWGKSLIDLADDLVHETAHHRLHDLEEAEGPLDRDDGEPRYHSPWRGSIRPVRGILHATYTFTYRAELLRRLALMADRRPRRRLPGSWLARELGKERQMLSGSLPALRDARRRELVSPAGALLLRDISSRVARLGRT